MRVDQLTFTRFIAAFLVILFHHYRVIPMMQFANVFVSYFYVLSGFVLMISQKSDYSTGQDYLHFFGARIARVYPLFWLCTLLAILFGLNTDGAGFLDVVLHTLGIQAFVPGYVTSLNYPGWSISVELFFYACFPFLVRHFYRKYALKTVLWATAIFWLASQTFLLLLYPSAANQNTTPLLHDFLFYFPVNHLNQFVCGNVVGLVFIRFHQQWKRNYDILILGLAGALFGYLNFIRPKVDLFDHNGLLIVLFAPIILLLALNTGLITRLFSRRPLIILGEISFGLYLLAEPLLKAFETLAQNIFRFNGPYLHYALAFVLLTSFAVYYFFEKPLQRYLKTAFRTLIHKWYSAPHKLQQEPAPRIMVAEKVA